MPEFHSSVAGYETLASRIAALHLAYEISKPQILWFGQLVSHSPSILQKLQDNICIPPREFPEMVYAVLIILLCLFTIMLNLIQELHLYAAEKMIDKLEPPLQKDINPNQSLAQWLNHVRLSQNVIDSILNLKSQSELNKTLR